jgi:hypothetical protein
MGTAVGVMHILWRVYVHDRLVQFYVGNYDLLHPNLVSG